MDANDKRNQSGGMFGRTEDEFSVRSANPITNFDFSDVQPIIGEYIDVNDQLVITFLANGGSNLVTVNVRVLTLDGKVVPFKFQIPTQPGIVSVTSRFQLAEGFLLSATAQYSQGFRAGNWCYVELALSRAGFTGADKYIPLWEGYAHFSVSYGYPGTPSVRSMDGQGVIRNFAVGAPAAGADIVVAVPTNTRWRVISFRATLVTSAAAGNRLVSITADDGASVFFESVSNFTQITGITNTYNAFDSAPYQNVPFNLRTQQPLASQLFLGPGFRLSTSTNGILAGDQWSASFVEVQEWADFN